MRLPLDDIPLRNEDRNMKESLVLREVQVRLSGMIRSLKMDRTNMVSESFLLMIFESHDRKDMDTHLLALSILDCSARCL